jgi:hypothetical protein
MLPNREQIIEKLLEQFHINVIERRIFNEDPLKLSEIKAYVTNALKTNSFFPAISAKQGLEGFYIEKTQQSIILHAKDYHGFIISKEYDSINDAVEIYISKEWNNNIDGINLVID